MAVEPSSGHLPSPALRVVVAGVSNGSICGVRDHALILAAALQTAGCEVSIAWLEAFAGQWTHPAQLGRELERRCLDERPDAVLLHYSVFAFSHHGIPVGVPALARRIRRLGVPLTILAHEFDYPWGRRGWRGTLHAITQRAALIPLMGACATVIVTTADRKQTLRSRWWLPRRQIEFTPVFSNIPRHPSVAAVIPIAGRVGVFSFGAEGLAAGLVAIAVADVAQRVPGAHLALIGAPGPRSAAGDQWRRAAAGVGCLLTFTGVADEAELSRQLAACDVVVSPDPGGPSPRKTSLAAALAHGKAVVALHGPNTWKAFLDAGALVVVDPNRAVLAAEIGRLLGDPIARAAVGSRAQAFYETYLSVEKTAEVVLKTISSHCDRLPPEEP